MKPVLAITPGEPAGIGPDICIRFVDSLRHTDNPSLTSQLLFIADPALLENRARQLGIAIEINEFSFQKKQAQNFKPGTMTVLPVNLAAACQPGQLNLGNASYVLETLRIATEGCLNDSFQALITGPVQKSIINDAGFSFSGHTEFLAELCQRKTVVMMLATEKLKVALVTTHLPLAQVPAAISAGKLHEVITILHADLITKFGIAKPRILVAGLNPHAGENGHLGREEVEIIQPVLEKLCNSGMNLIGPLPADTLFTEKYLSNADAVLAMYHDQGLPVLKYQGFGKAINITLGLPIIRTSVDHGTALDLAGTGKAEYGSLQAAILAADFMCQQQALARN